MTPRKPPRSWPAAALLLLAQQPALEVDTRFQGTPAEAMQAVARLSAEEPERAIALAASFAEDEERPEAVRAEFRYAEGLALAGAGGLGPAAQAFASARALAGPGELRTAATYNQGTAELLAAEAQRLQTFKALQDPAAAGAPAGAAAGDPLAALRQVYLVAKATLVERLRADFADPDTRANLELVQRRLRELDDLEQQQEEEQQQQQDEQGDPNEEDQQGEKGEGKPDESQGDEEQQEQQEQGEKGEEQAEQQGKPPPAPADDPNAADPANQEAPQPSGAEEREAAANEGQGEPAERVLSREQVLRLLDKLDSIEEEAATLEALLRASRRVPVDKDW
jgi:hypothetical protein